MLGDLGHARAPPHARARAGPDAATISGMTDLRGRSIRTLAWLGDAEFEREVRLRLARRGDYPTDRLHNLKARVVCAEAQAELLAAIEPELDELEAGVVRRGRNVNLKAAGRGARNVRAYRAATGLEALVAHWFLGDAASRARFDQLVAPRLEQAIDAAMAGPRPPRPV
jgi:ribonuclease-3 family protein